VRYARNPAVLWRSTSQGPVVLVPGRELPTRLSGLAAVVWEVLDEPLDAGRLADEVAGVLDDRPDLGRCLAELRHATLVVSDPG
jgi:hypothetical protein